jgi:hypothetical protein
MILHYFRIMSSRSTGMIFRLKAGYLFLLVMAVLFGSANNSFSQVPIDLNGKVTTKQGTAAFDVVLTLQNAKISDTADTSGNYKLFRQGANLLRNDRLISQMRIDNGSVGKMVCVGGPLTEREKNIDAVVIDLHGRTIGQAHELFNQTKNHVPEGVYFLYRGVSSPEPSGDTRAKLVEATPDTISLSYQGTFLKKVAVNQLSGMLNIALDADLPARKHSVLVASYSNNSAYMLSADNQVTWQYTMPGPVQDAWLLPNGNVLVCGGSDVREISQSKQIVWKYTASAGEIHNCSPLPGNVVLFGENSSGKIFEINRTTNTVLRTIQTQVQGDNHSRFRMVRKTFDSTYLVAAEGEGNVYELSKTGTVIRKISGENMKTKYGVTWGAVHSALKLANGNILIGGGYNSPFIEVDQKDSVVWKLSAEDIPEIGLNYTAAGQILPGGTFVFSTYSSTYKLVEVTHSKKVLWKLQNSAIGNPTHVYVTDCWDTKCDMPAPETLVR